MARQQKLLASLGPEPTVPPTARRRLTAEEHAAHLGAEQAATDAAFEHLAAGRLDVARELLQPHADAALEVRTLTTLSRILSMQGHFDEAHELLLRAERRAPADPKVVYFMAELHKLRGQHMEELQYRRRAAYTAADAPAESYVPLITAIVKATPAGAEPPLGEIRLALERVRANPGLPPQVRIDVARSIFGIRSLVQDACALYAEAVPPPAHEHDLLARWTPLQAWCQAQSAPLHRSVDFGVPGRRPLLAELPDAIVHPGFQWLPLLDGGSTALSGLAASRIRLHDEGPASPVLLASAKSALLRLPKELPHHERSALLIGGNGAYYHDLVEYLGGLAVAETLGIADDVPMLVNAAMAPHMEQMLELLDIAPERLWRCPPDSPVRVSRLYLPTRLAAGGRWFDPLLPHWYRRRLAPHLSTASPSRRLYLSRGSTARRRIDNEAELAEALARQGFESVQPERLSLRDQVRLFSEATHIVGSSGAALTNMLFSPAGAKVFVLQNRQLVEGGGDLYFDALARACGHDARTLACTPVRLATGQRSIDADLQADVLALLELLQ